MNKSQVIFIRSLNENFYLLNKKYNSNNLKTKNLCNKFLMFYLLYCNYFCLRLTNKISPIRTIRKIESHQSSKFIKYYILTCCVKNMKSLKFQLRIKHHHLKIFKCFRYFIHFAEQ